MSRSRRTLPAIAVISVSLLLASCGADGAPTPQESDAPGGSRAPEASGADPAAGDGVVSIAYAGDIASLDPSQGYDYISWPAERLIFETLLTYDAGTELVPGLAATMPEISEDGTVFTFTLRDGVSFVNPDGSVHREMTADDVVFSINRLLSPNLTPAPSPVAEAFFAVIDGGQAVIDGEATEASGLVALDDTTVEITLSYADPTFLNLMAMPFASIVPSDVATDDTEAFADAPVGTGPYTLESYTVGDRAVFVPNQHYWGDAPANGGVEMRFGVDGTTAVQQVEADQLDIMGDPIPSGIYNDILTRYPDRVVIVSQIIVNYLAIDTSNPDGGPLTDVNVRRAIAHAIDKDNIVQLVRGRAVPANCIFPTDLPGHDPACAPYPYDPDAARDLLTDAGYPDGFETTLYTDTTEDSTAIAQAIQQDLGAVGIEIEIVTQEFDVLLGTIAEPHAAPLVYIGWFMDYPDPSDFYDPLFACASAVEGGPNISWYCNEELDAFAAEAKVIQDPAERLDAYGEVERRVMDDVPVVPITFPLVDTFLSSRLLNFEPHPVWFVDLARYAVDG